MSTDSLPNYLVESLTAATALGVQPKVGRATPRAVSRGNCVFYFHDSPELRRALVALAEGALVIDPYAYDAERSRLVGQVRGTLERYRREQQVEDGR